MHAVFFSPLFGQWPFTFGAMLWWAAAAVIPIAIHFLSRRRYRETSWAAMQFLLAAAKKHARRLRIEQLILLVLRVCVLIMLAIALADPSFYHRARSWSAGGGNTHWVLVLDGSYSMDYRVAEQSLFELAQNAAREIVSHAEQGDGFTLVLMSKPPVSVIREPVFDSGDALRVIDSLQVRHTGADLTATLRELQEIVETTSRRQPRLTETRICFFTDLGRTTWEAVESESCRRMLGELDERADVHLVELGEGPLHNAAITRLAASQGTAIVDREIQFTAEVRRFSATAPQQARAEWLVNDQVVHEEQVDLTSGGDVLTLTRRFANPGEHQVELRLAGADPLDVDNHRWRIVLVRESLRVLCVEGEPGAARYVAAALEPRATDTPAIRWEIVTERALVERDLADYDCIFLCNVARFSGDEAAALSNYVRGGGGLGIFLGDQVQSSDYNDKLGGSSQQPRILPAELGDVVATEMRGFDPLDYKHRLVEPFADHERAGLLTVPTWNYIRLQLPNSFTGSVALNFPNGDPALVEESIALGKVILFASAATASSRADVGQTPWTELAVWPSFLPIIQQMVASLVESAAVTRHGISGEPLLGSVPADLTAPFVTITTPDGNSERIMVHAEADGSNREWRFTEAYRSGIYHVELDENEKPKQRFAVNVDVAESGLERIDQNRIPTQITIGLQDTETSVDEAPYAPASFARWALAALLGLLLLETYLAWLFGTARV